MLYCQQYGIVCFWLAADSFPMKAASEAQRAASAGQTDTPLVIFFSNRFCVISHHFWLRGDEREKVEHYESVKAAFAGKLTDLIQGAIKFPLVGN